MAHFFSFSGTVLDTHANVFFVYNFLILGRILQLECKKSSCKISPDRESIWLLTSKCEWTNVKVYM